MTLPDCMMPDGADPCKGYMELQAENKRLREEIKQLRTRRKHKAALGCLCDSCEVIRLQESLDRFQEENKQLRQHPNGGDLIAALADLKRANDEIAKLKKQNEALNKILDLTAP